MTKRNIIISSSIIFVLAVTIGIFSITSARPTTQKKSQIPVTIREKAKVDEQPTTDVPVEVTTPDTTNTTTSVTPVTAPANPTNPTLYLYATSDDHPGSGSFEFPVSTNGDWTVNFTSSCDTGKVGVFITAGDQMVIPSSFPNGPFASTTGNIRVVVPEGQSCTWRLSVS